MSHVSCLCRILLTRLHAFLKQEIERKKIVTNIGTYGSEHYSKDVNLGRRIMHFTVNMATACDQQYVEF
jgi:hypothetical protein